MKTKPEQGGEQSPPDQSVCPPTSSPAPLVQAVQHHRRSDEIEDETLIEMTALLDALTRKYRGSIKCQIEIRRILKKEILITELSRSYLEQEAAVMSDHIGKLFGLYQQANHERGLMRKWVNKLYPGWKRIFDEACRRASNSV